jgi:uncharacterized iron-regulated membrane protein
MILTLFVAVGAVLLAVTGRALLVLEEITELLAKERQRQGASLGPEALVPDAIADEKLVRAQGKARAPPAPSCDAFVS